MTNRDLLERALRYRYRFMSVQIAMVCLILGGEYAHRVRRLSDEQMIPVYLLGFAVIVVVPMLQRWIARLAFKCPQCHANLWDVHDLALESEHFHCPHCDADMDAPAHPANPTAAR
jgi:transcription initiation factor IIE alpha subunit